MRWWDWALVTENNGQRFGLERHLRVMVVQEISEQRHSFHDKLRRIGWELPANISSSRQCYPLEACHAPPRRRTVSRSEYEISTKTESWIEINT
jgi:hypothetical protein